jgi:hypothetical protein
MRIGSDTDCGAGEIRGVEGGAWTVFKLGRGIYARLIRLVELPEAEAKAHAAMLNLRFGREFVYWAQRPRETAK